jgi:hypothetical protein
MHFRNGQAQGFALFASGSLARAAVDNIQNLVFDNDCVLRAEMAHKNMCAPRWPRQRCRQRPAPCLWVLARPGCIGLHGPKLAPPRVAGT